MKIEVRKFEDSLESDWDQFVEYESLNGTFLHLRKFYKHNALNVQDDNSYLFFKKNKIIGIIPFNLFLIGNKLILNSYLRATYGGFIVSSEVGVEEALEMVEYVIEEAKKMQVNEILIRNPFRIFNYNICDETDYAMWYNGFSIKYRELEIAIQLGNKTEVEKKYSDSTKRSINKGKKILTVEESMEYKKYWSILKKNLLDKHSVNPTHNFNEFSALLENIGTEKIKLFVAKLEGEIIAGILVFLVNKMAIHAQYIASDLSFQEYRPLNVVIDHIIDYGCERKYRFFNLGMANQDNGRVINAGLLRFKEGFGGRGVLRETMHLHINNSSVG